MSVFNPDFKRIKGKRNAKITKFLKEIEDPNSGVYFREFDDVTDLDIEVQRALISTVSENFRKNRGGGGGEKEITHEVSRERFTLASGKILNFKIPAVLSRGKIYTVKAKINGNGRYIFLTLMLANPEKEQAWWVDNNTIDLALNGGKMELKQEDYSNTWSFPIYPDAKVGKYIGFLGMYQDTYDLPTVNRRLIDYSQKKIQVI